jgi:hypothetical protein
MQPMISSLATVTTTASAIVTKTANATRTIVLQPDASDINIGGSDVTTSNGLTITKGTQFTFVLPPQQDLYAVVNTVIHTVRIFRPSGDF